MIHPAPHELVVPFSTTVKEHLASCALCGAMANMLDVDPLPERLVGLDQYDEAKQPLATGGMAVVHEASDHRLPRCVILKRPRTVDLAGAALPPETRLQFENRLKAEARILARLQHPAIVTIHEQGRTEDDVPFLVLERVSGRSLAAILEEIEQQERSSGQRQASRRVTLLASMVPIAEALAFAHAQNIVHRDVTPNNIIIGDRGEATLIDWGIAHDGNDQRRGREIAGAELPLPEMTSEQRFATICAGTPPYVSLEQAQGLPAQPSYDVYSFGVTLYHVVAGQPPFPGEDQSAFMKCLTRGDRIEPVAPWDRQLSEIIARAMSRRPEARPDAATLMMQLKTYLTGELVFVHGHRFVGRVTRWIWYRRGAAIALTSGMVALILLAVVWSILSARSQRAAEVAADSAEVAAAAAEAEASAKGALAVAREREADKERARASAESRLAIAQSKERNAETIAATRHQEAATARREAATADRASAKYRMLMEEAKQKEHDAEEARRVASEVTYVAQRDLEATRIAAQQARRDADAASESAYAAKRDLEVARIAAQQARRDADKVRADAQQARKAAEDERDKSNRAAAEAQERVTKAEAARKTAEDDRDLANRAAAEAQEKVTMVEAARDQALARLREFEAEPPSGGQAIKAGGSGAGASAGVDSGAVELPRDSADGK